MSRYAGLFADPLKLDVQAVPDVYGRAERYSLLFVDDEEGVLAAMKRVFMDENYEVLTASSGERALTILNRQPVHLVVSDHRMPGMTGAELLRSIKENWPETIRIMLTGHADVSSIMGAVQEGAVYKFITKPWHDDDLRLTVSLALQQYLLLHENRHLRNLAQAQQQKIRSFAGLLGEDRGMMGMLLVKAGLVSAQDLATAAAQATPGEFLADLLSRLGYCSEQAVLRVMQQELNIEPIDLRETAILPATARFIPRDVCEQNRLLPVRLEGRTLTVAMADPSDIGKIDILAMMTGCKVTPVLASSSAIAAVIPALYGDGAQCFYDDHADVQDPIDEIDIVIEDDDATCSVQELLGSSEMPPVVRIVNAIISEAIRYRASDIHIEARTKCTLVRFRVDGMLHGKIRVPADLHGAIVSRIKILAKMDIAERRRPQDGRITAKAGIRVVDMRVSSLPTLNGEKVVLRLLDKGSSIRGLDEQGFLEDHLKTVQTLIRKPQGVIITTGPTGSGKTTMLYSLLAAMLEGSRNFETIEEPVEYFLEEANQVSVREKIGLTFAQVLRATLRQDPDVILVGEIRDEETADVAFKASLTGHTVLTSLHTNSAVASITRLIDMGVKPYIIASAVEGIIAQRLVRRICPECAIDIAPDPTIMELLSVPSGFLGETVKVGKGCERCDGGYRGRLGIYEVFVMNEQFRQMICTDYRESELLDQARSAGMRLLSEDGLAKVRQGLTTLEELLRVVGPCIVHQRICPTCNRGLDARFLHCPYCGTSRQDCCRACHSRLDPDWSTCPHCGKRKE
jgi:type II secretory ATPase GspE/PulE/Tfp pilus assembly ATPase PilB-like protein/FixJ family two-component response regulator